ncbi:C2 family cysteine protease [Nocardia sp. NPDC057030]|uniref:C2 family cysteine protease n=1 Tax=unclassified Nocardia TaxID=2637762 RepID=UPI003638D550
MQVSAKKAGKTFATLGVNRNKGWVTIRSDGSAEVQQSTVKADTGRTGSGTRRTARTDQPTAATRAHDSESDDEYLGGTDAEAGDAQLRQWFARNVFDDAFDRAVRGRPLRDGTGAEDLSDLEGVSDDVRDPAPAAGLFADETGESGVRLSEDALADLFRSSTPTGTQTETIAPAAHSDTAVPDTATLLALPPHAAPAVAGTVPQDRTVLIDRLGNPHILGVDEGWRVLGTRFTHPDTGHEYVGLVPFDQKTDVDPIWVRDGLLDQAFHLQKRLFPWGTDCYLTLPGLGFDGAAGRAQWLPGGSSITVKPAQNADGTADLSRTMFRDPQATDPAHAWRTLPRPVLGVALPGLRAFDGPLWHAEHGPLESDVRQGRLGDCFFVANMIALARSSRQPIPEMMVDLGDSVAVRFFDQAGAPVWKRVTKDLYVNGDGTARNAAHLGVLWPAMLEKAYAVFAGDTGYAGLDGGDPVDAARNLQPANLSGGLRSQPSRAVMDHYFLHPMRMDHDAYTRFASGDEEFARTITALHSTWEAELRAHIARERNPVGDGADSALVLRLIETHGEVRQAIQEFHRQIRPDNPASATGFRRFLEGHLSADQRTRWAAHIDALVDHTGREAAWRDRLLDPATMRPVADRVQFALDRGDLVMLSTRPWGVDDTALVPGLVGGHAYTVLGVERDAHGDPTALTLRNPWGSHTETPAPLPGIRHDDDGVVHVNLEHLNKFGKLTVSGSGARALFGLDELPLPFASLVRMAAAGEEAGSGAHVRTDSADADDLAVAHVTHPLELKRRFATIRLRLDKNLLLGETENTSVYTFRAKQLVQSPILDNQGRTIGITFLHEEAQLRLLHGWGSAANGHDRVVRMRSDEADITAVMSDPAKLTPDRLAAAPWAGEYRNGRIGPLYVSVHAAENGFEVQLRSGKAVAVDGQTFASIIKTSPAFRDAMATDPARSVVMIACEIAAGPAGRDFAQAVHESFPQSRVYASQGSVQTYVDSSLGIGLLGAVRDHGWVSYFNGSGTNYPRTRFPITGAVSAAPEVVSASVIHSGSDDDAYTSDSASDAALGDELTTTDMTHPLEWRARLHTLRRMLTEDPLLGVTPGSYVVKFEAKDVLSHPLRNHLGETIGVSFHHKNDLRGAQLWAQTEIGHDSVIRMDADETDMLAIGNRIRNNALNGANSHPEIVAAPWQREYRDGRNGPVYISAHAGPDHFEIRLKSKVSIIVDGRTFASIVESAQPFRDALTSGTLPQGTSKSFVLVACEAAKGEAGSGFADAMRVNFPDSRIYASQGVVHTAVVDISTPTIRLPDMSMIGAHNNAGWISYLQGRGYQYANTRYPAQNPPANFVVPQANLPATGTTHSSPSYSAGTLFGVRLRRPRERSTDE